MFYKNNEWIEWIKVKDTLALEIKTIVEKNKASFAFPSTSIYVEKKSMKSVLILFDQAVSLYIWILIINVIISWLVAFNILNTSNRFVYSVLDVSYKLTNSSFKLYKKISS